MYRAECRKLKVIFKTFLVNYALFQPAKQPSTFGEWSASAAVDGVRSTSVASGACIHTQAGKGDWWTVDLGKLVDVYAVAITNRGDNVQTMDNFAIRVGENWHPSKNPSCAGYQSLELAETKAIFCSRPVRGNNVGIIQKRGTDVLNFCEISVHGREVGTLISKEPGKLATILQGSKYT